ncbi:MAG: 30S ribosomal protein S17 [Candidatus Bipolaricaulota bacterium]|nr:30S ribosomal protein S17 [Candidatus Bipolaricaulota bacterium]
MPKREKIGRVVSDKMAKTITVLVETRVQHPLYKKHYMQRAKFYAHDEQEQAKQGDLVRIIECRPLSRLKRWRLVEVLERARPGQS